MKKPGEVQSIDHDYALVTMQRGAGCGAEKCPLSAPLLDDYGKVTFQVRAKNPVEASPGDTVLVEIEDQTALLIAFSLYLLPILLAFFAYFLIRLVTENTVMIATAVIASLVISVLILRRLDRILQPRYDIVGFVDREEICTACPLTAKQRESEEKNP